MLLVRALAVLQLARIALWLVYRKGFFSDLTAGEFFKGMFFGLRFDLAAAMYLVGLPILFMMLPMSAVAKSRRFQDFWGWIGLAGVCALAFISVGDILYFDYVKRHVADELAIVGSDLSLFWKMAAGSHAAYSLLIMFALVVFGWDWRRVLNRPIVVEGVRRRIAYFALWAFFIFTSLRGGFFLKPISTLDAFISSKPSQGQIVLNGVFSMFQALISSDQDLHVAVPDEAIAKGQNDLGFDAKSSFPLKPREVPPRTGPKRNVVVLLLESWSSFYVDSFGGNNFGVTPNFDWLAANGLKFEKFYANGERSIEGIQTVLTGVPAVKGRPTIGSGLELMNIPRIGNVLREGGYHSIFIQTSSRQSFRMDSLAKAVGFDEYYGREDAPPVLEYEDPSDPQFGWDYESLMLLKSRLSEAGKDDRRFFAFFFSGTTHSPFARVPMQHQKYPHHPDSENGFLNTLAYSDWAIGQFFREAQGEPWFDNTVFILTADHTLGAFRNLDYPGRHRVPLVVYQPSEIEPDVVKTVSSQIDVFPTIMELTGDRGTTPVLGRSLLSGGSGYAFITGRFDWPGWITEEGYVRHTMVKRLDAQSFHDRCGAPCLEKMENRLVGMTVMVTDLVQKNRWVPDTTGGAP